MPPTVSFAEVLAAAKNQHKREIGWLYQRYVNVVYRYALARVADISTAEDLTSETFFAMIRNISTTRAEDELTFAAWLLGIARNQVLMHFRKARAQREVELLPHIEDETQTIAEEADPLLVLTARESWAETAHAINQLTLEQRTVVLYRCILGFPTEYVAEMMGRQPGTIRALQFRALNSLARFLKAYPDSEMPERGRNRVG
jgi:RNA polymerase sigma-70 factor (ECF subfamily)